MPTTCERVEAGATFAACLYFTLNCNLVLAENLIPRQGDTCPTSPINSNNSKPSLSSQAMWHATKRANSS